MEETPEIFPNLTPDLASSLFGAIYILDNLERHKSRRILLQAIASQSFGLQHLRNLFCEAVDASLVNLARECLEIIESKELTYTQDEWIRKAHLRLGDITPFTAELLRSRLQGIPKKIQSNHSGPICYILHMSLPHNTTGYSMRTQEFVKAMMSSGQQIYCMTRPGFPVDIGQENFFEYDTVDGVTYYRAAEPSRIRSRQTSYIDQAADVLVKKFEELRPAIVMAASNHENSAPALLAARRLGIPFVYEMRGLWELTKLSVNSRYKENPQFQRSFDLEAQIAESSDQVFTLTEGMAKELRLRGVSNARIDILPNAADPERFKPRKRDEKIASKLNISPKTVVIGYVGSFTPYEGLDDLIRACGILHRRGRDFHILLIGDEALHLKDQVIPELRYLVSQEDLEKKTTMTGRIPASEVERFYSLVDISPIPRKLTPVTELVSPLKPFEAMSMEKSVILPDLQAMLDIVQDGKTGAFYKKGNFLSLAEALDDLLLNPKKRKDLGQSARRWIVRKGNWKAVADRCILAFESIRV
ncbi:glycosyltransferase [Limimaricola cinnabarinus]|uniref:glycosyltransferase n=1 Tax=Limimaricola cinnabarinus TaxID=1125964 RepID=UPI002FDF0B50